MYFSSSRSSRPFKLTLVMLALCLAFSATTVFAETNEADPTPLTAESANQFLDQFFAQPELEGSYIGASVVIVKDGEVLANRGFGYADAANQLEVDPDTTVFRIASVSKSVTALAAMQLVEQGAIELDQDFLVYLPDLELDNPFSTPVTVGDLLAHTTGFEIRDPNPTDIHNDFDKFVGMEEYIKANMPAVVREPGTSYMYDNFASLLVGYLVETVSGMPFEEYMEQNIFEPLGMDTSGFLLEGSLREQLAVGYDAAGQPLDLYTLTPTVMPHGGMLSTSADIGKFMLSFLSGGSSDIPSLISEETRQAMTVYQSSIHPLLPDTTYGFEAPMQLPEAGADSRVITKAGDLNGFSSYLWMIPEDNTGVFVTYNNNGMLRNLLYPAFMYEFYPEWTQPADFSGYAPELDADMSIYTGLFTDLRLNSMVSTVESPEGEDLVISDALLGARPLIQVEDHLFIDAYGMLTGFKVEEDGTVSYMKEPHLNPLGYTRKGQPAQGFADIAEDHPFASYIMSMQSLGYYDNDAALEFGPDLPVTRAEYIERYMQILNRKPQGIITEAFPDVKGHPSEKAILAAVELGLIAGNDQGLFEPDRAITRQEAAVIVWRIASAILPKEMYESIPLLEGSTDAWAQEAVQMAILLGLHGPEVTVSDAGIYDFKSRQPMTRAEEAAHHFQALTNPVQGQVMGIQ
ncbi:serine hydrolase [Paenibacillus senegalensis]|uniref:serine hydrolase n=1 Tax=Paenibacillus senegalensis TaxID=1465766 RepID=UPI00028815F5|nr:serine hydrolase [Paenibacillus senegalensis]